MTIVIIRMATVHAGTVITGIAICICTDGIKEGVNWKTTQEMGKETTGFNAKMKFCQDLLVVFFGKQHAQGGCNDNPTSHQFLRIPVSIRIQETVATDPAHGNYRKRPC